MGGWEVSNIYVTSGFNVFRVARRAPSGLQRGLLIRPPCPPTFRHCQPSEGKPRLPSCVPSLTTGPRSEVSTPPPPTSFRLRRGADTLPIPAISSRNATAHVKRPQILLTMSIPASFQPQRLGPLYVNFLAAAHQPSSVPSSALPPITERPRPLSPFRPVAYTIWLVTHPPSSVPSRSWL